VTCVDHRYQAATQRCSPHCDARPDPADINALVIHGISLPAGEFGGADVDALFMGTLDTSQRADYAPLAGLRVSAHIFIRRTGEVIQYVPFDQRAWHAGRSNYCGRRRCNAFTIGVELEGTDDTPYTEEQYQQLVALTMSLLATYPHFNRRRIVGHEQIAPGRKTDPGPAFSWTYFETLLTLATEPEVYSHAGERPSDGFRTRTTLNPWQRVASESLVPTMDGLGTATNQLAAVGSACSPATFGWNSAQCCTSNRDRVGGKPDQSWFGYLLSECHGAAGSYGK